MHEFEFRDVERVEGMRAGMSALLAKLGRKDQKVLITNGDLRQVPGECSDWTGRDLGQVESGISRALDGSPQEGVGPRLFQDPVSFLWVGRPESRWVHSWTLLLSSSSSFLESSCIFRQGQPGG